MTLGVQVSHGMYRMSATSGLESGSWPPRAPTVGPGHSVFLAMTHHGSLKKSDAPNDLPLSPKPLADLPAFPEKLVHSVGPGPFGGHLGKTQKRLKENTGLAQWAPPGHRHTGSCTGC